MDGGPPFTNIGIGNGTSFATVHVAAAAAMWLRLRGQELDDREPVVARLHGHLVAPSGGGHVEQEEQVHEGPGQSDDGSGLAPFTSRAASPIDSDPAPGLVHSSSMASSSVT